LLKIKFVEAKQAGDVETCRQIMTQLKKSESPNKAEKTSGATTKASIIAAKSDDATVTYTVEDLKTKPLGLDHSKLETYLNDKQFRAAFKMPKAQFSKLPKSKQDSLKISLGLL